MLLEHVRSPVASVRTVQRLLEPLLLRLEGDHLRREPDEGAVRAGLQVELLERSQLGIVLRLSARKTDDGTSAAASTDSYEKGNAL